MSKVDMPEVLDAGQDPTSIGNVALRLGIINEEQLRQALDTQAERRGTKLGDILVLLGFIKDATLRRMCTTQHEFRERRLTKKYNFALDHVQDALHAVRSSVEQMDTIVDAPAKKDPRGSK